MQLIYDCFMYVYIISSSNEIMDLPILGTGVLMQLNTSLIADVKTISKIVSGYSWDSS